MTSTMTTTLGTSNLRQSSRQTRTNPTRTSKTLGSSLRQNSLVDNPVTPAVTTNEPQGIYPAIQHFTDAITALPREYRRHTSLLKEVDAKAWAPEEHLQSLLRACLANKPPRFPTTALPSAAASTTGPIDNTAQIGGADSVAGTQNEIASQASLPTDPVNYPRRKLFYDLRYTLNEMMVTMDEKNHVINNASEEVGRQLQRLNTIFPHLDKEISEETRLGSSTHWAYAENRHSARALAGGESRSRKEAAAGLAIMQNENVAARSESRREAMLANKRVKQAHQQQDSDFDELKSTSRRPNVNGKAKRVGELAAESTLGLGISNAPQPTRKKRPEKLTAGGVAMERTTSSHMGGTSMSRQASQQEPTKKRRAPKDSTNTGSRKRNHTATSAANSPLLGLASSPIVGTFGKEARSSPAPKPQTSRARQNSLQTDATKARPSSSASLKASSNGVGAASAQDLQQVGMLTGKSAAEVKATMKESTNKNGDRLFEADSKATNGDSESIVRGGILLERTSSKASHTEKLKREADDTSEAGRGRKNSSTAASPRLPPSGLASAESTSARPERRRAASSKTSTPVVSTFAEATSSSGSNGNGSSGRPPNRPSRQNTLTSNPSTSTSETGTGLAPTKRSHKKGAGLAAQAAAAAARQAVEPPRALDDADLDEEMGDGEVEGDEPRYCYCQGVSYGEMVACDAEDCPREWFHLKCAGLDRAPSRNAKWYCVDCKARQKKDRGMEVSVR